MSVLLTLHHDLWPQSILFRMNSLSGCCTDLCSYMYVLQLQQVQASLFSPLVLLHCWVLAHCYPFMVLTIFPEVCSGHCRLSIMTSVVNRCLCSFTASVCTVCLSLGGSVPMCVCVCDTGFVCCHGTVHWRYCLWDQKHSANILYILC